MTNIYKVPGSQWKKWNEQEKNLFNSLISFSLSNAHLMQHPMSPALTDEYWKTIAWNHAWMAADTLLYARKAKP